jgi:signal transduction histidine kinase
VLWVAYLAFGAVAIACAGAFAFPAADQFAGSQTWAFTILIGSVPALGFISVLLIQHLTAEPSGPERARTWLLIGAFTIGTIGCLTDLFARLGNLGTLASTVLLATLVLRFGLFERNVSTVMALNAVIAGAVQVLLYLAVFRFFGTNEAMLMLGTATVTLALLPVVRGQVRSALVHRQRLEYLATLGRFSAQMAHDLRNPLAAIKGAGQLLELEKELKAPAMEHVGLILGQVERINRVISEYQRLGRLEVALAPVDLNALVREVCGSQAIAIGPGIELKTELAPVLPACQGDRDLLTAALENVIRNAVEASPKGGSITVRTEDASSAGAGFVAISVADTGQGMDPRVLARALDDFFTTKSSGSGLGLPFVRRVAEVHGGDLSLHSVEGKGTTVRWRLRAE